MMAKVVLYNEEAFITVMEKHAQPTTHFVVTDESSVITLVPRVTSKHRHYYQYMELKDPRVIGILIEKAKELGYDVLPGHVQETTS